MQFDLFPFNWRQILWLFVALQPFILWLILYWKKQNQQQKFADSHLLAWLQVHDKKNIRQRIFSRDMAYFIAWLLFALALAGPRLPDPSAKNQNEITLDVMVVVDVSRSMMASDIKPSRLRRATLELYEFLSLAKNTRVGVIVYAARPHLFVPLTSDFNALQFYLKNLDSLQLPTLGSDASSALAFAQKELQALPSKHQQAIIWMTDGDMEDKELSNIEGIITHAKSQNIPTYILGLGTQEGAAIPLKNGTWLEHEGQGVISRIHTQDLQQLAKVSKGKFVQVANDESDWQTLYHDGMLLNMKNAKQPDHQQWTEFFSWFLFPAIVFLIIAVLPFQWKPLSNTKKVGVTPLILIFLAVNMFGNMPVDAAEKNYESDLSNGIKAYKKAKYAKSKGAFIQSVLTAKNVQERGIALHNLGNALFQSGDYKSATEVFTDALRYIPNQKQTIKNQKLAFNLFTIFEKRRQRLSSQGNLNTQNKDAQLYDLPDIMPFMLSAKAVNLLKASLPELPEDELNRLLGKGMKHFQLIEGDIKLKAKKKKQQQDLEQARIHFMGLEEQDSNALWKRLFEIEEGFPASVEKPKVIPNVRPW